VFSLRDFLWPFSTVSWMEKCGPNSTNGGTSGSPRARTKTHGSHWTRFHQSSTTGQLNPLIQSINRLHAIYPVSITLYSALHWLTWIEFEMCFFMTLLSFKLSKLYECVKFNNLKVLLQSIQSLRLWRTVEAISISSVDWIHCFYLNLLADQLMRICSQMGSVVEMGLKSLKLGQPIPVGAIDEAMPVIRSSLKSMCFFRTQEKSWTRFCHMSLRTRKVKR